MNKHFMVDIETTGVDVQKDDLLQVALLELEYMHNNLPYWSPGNSIVITLHSDRQPESDFAKRHQKDLYQKCNEAPVLSTEEIRKQLLEYFEKCGVKPGPDLKFMGNNASNFDLPFLDRYGILSRNEYHYRIYDMSGAISLAQDALNITDRSSLGKAAFHLFPYIEMPKGLGSHDGLYDCYHQARVLNGILRLMRGGKL